MKKVLLLGFLVVCCYNSFSQTGVLDQTFGNGGIVHNMSGNFIAASLYHTSIALQNDGKIIQAGGGYGSTGSRFCLLRYKDNGFLDSSFGINGRVSNGLSSKENVITDVLIQTDSKIVTACSFDTNFVSYTALVRYNTNGSLDSSFGNNGSRILINRKRITSLTQEPSGKLLLVADSNYSVKVYRYNIDGTDDITFNFENPYNAVNYIQPQCVTTQPNGKIIVGGYVTVGFSNGPRYMLAARRFNSDGSIDSSFEVNSYFSSDTGYAHNVMVQSDGKIIVSGYHPFYSIATGNVYWARLARFNADGTPDISFGINGTIRTYFPPSGQGSDYWLGAKVYMLPGGKYLQTCYNVYGGNRENLLIRYNADGSLDTTFARKGFLKTIISSNGTDYQNFTCLQPDGKIILTGVCPIGANTANGGIAMARLNLNNDYLYNEINFEAFIDYNKNGIKEPQEPLYKSIGGTLSKSVGIPIYDTTYLYSDKGHFEMQIDTGTYVTQLRPFPSYYNVVPTAHLTSNSSYFNRDTFAFALQPKLGISDLAILVYSPSRLRPAMGTSYHIYCFNIGTDTLNGSFHFVLSNKVIYNSASTIPNSINGDTLNWNFSNLKPLDTLDVNVYATVPATAVLRDTVKIEAYILPITGDADQTNNKEKFTQLIAASLDPNDKTENHGGRITNTQVANGDYMQYTIRFQNTGNDTAFNVYIHDTLDTKLDWSTLQVITASHNYQMTMSDGKCLFKFPAINLVDSIHNEPGSHGYIVYRVKPLPTVQVGDVIKNTAAIYFDYNLPVYTNTEMTTVVAETFPLKLLAFIAKKQDKANLLNWTTSNEVNVDHFDIERSSNPNTAVWTGIREFSTIGKVKAGLGNYSFTDNSPLKATNYYRLKMVDKDGQFTYSPVRQINIKPSPLNITIYPNPAKDNLQVIIDNDKKTGLQLQVLSQDGKVVLSNSINANEGSILRSINISSLPKGSYWVKVVQASPSGVGDEEAAVKFVKQ